MSGQLVLLITQQLDMRPHLDAVLNLTPPEDGLLRKVAVVRQRVDVDVEEVLSLQDAAALRDW